MQLKISTDQNKWFPPVPAVVTQTDTECKPYRKNPNLWIPQSIEREHKYLFMLHAKVNIRSLIRPQEVSQARPFYPTMRQWVNYVAPVNCGPYWDWDVI